MREILFRGKRIDNGEWVEGELLHDMQGRPWIYWKTPKELPIVFSRCAIVCPETVGQYTGLIDKNGKKIFEGDILTTENGTFSNTGMGHILFYKGMWTSFYGQDAIGRDCFDELHTVCNSREVIGNIHDNPELIGGMEDGEKAD